MNQGTYSVSSALFSRWLKFAVSSTRVQHFPSPLLWIEGRPGVHCHSQGPQTTASDCFQSSGGPPPISTVDKTQSGQQTIASGCCLLSRGLPPICTSTGKEHTTRSTDDYFWLRPFFWSLSSHSNCWQNAQPGQQITSGWYLISGGSPPI